MQEVMRRAGLDNEEDACDRLQAVQALLPGLVWGSAGGARAADLAALIQDLQGTANKLVALKEALPEVDVAALVSSREGVARLAQHPVQQLRQDAEQVRRVLHAVVQHKLWKTHILQCQDLQTPHGPVGALRVGGLPGLAGSLTRMSCASGSSGVWD
jgi:uncharacterized protein (DUF2267 family)